MCQLTQELQFTSYIKLNKTKAAIFFNKCGLFIRRFVKQATDLHCMTQLKYIIRFICENSRVVVSNI